MTIPSDIEDKLDADPSWAVQHEDIVQVMDETTKGKPWSRYMIQQHLDGNPAKKTVNDRLNELVELEVLVEYEYSSISLYDLAYDPIITDGGQLKDANLVELATFRDRNSIRDLAAGAFFLALLFFGIGVLTETTRLTGNISSSGNFYIDVAFALYLLAAVLLFSVGTLQKVDSWITGDNPS